MTSIARRPGAGPSGRRPADPGWLSSGDPGWRMGSSWRRRSRWA